MCAPFHIYYIGTQYNLHFVFKPKNSFMHCMLIKVDVLYAVPFFSRIFAFICCGFYVQKPNIIGVLCHSQMHLET